MTQTDLVTKALEKAKAKLIEYQTETDLIFDQELALVLKAINGALPVVRDLERELTQAKAEIEGLRLEQAALDKTICQLVHIDPHYTPEHAEHVMRRYLAASKKED